MNFSNPASGNDTVMQTRRGILMGFAVAATAATLPLQSGAAPRMAENPDLLALAEKLPVAAKAYSEARSEVARIVAAWSPFWPTLPTSPEIVRFGEGCKPHRDIEGRGIQTPCGNGNAMRVQDLGTPEVFEQSYAWHMAEAARKAALPSQRGLKGKLLWAEREKARIEPARAYWNEVARITAASGIEAATAHSTNMRAALHSLVDTIMATREATIEGVAIKAQALATWSQVDHVSKALNLRASDWSDQIAAAILRQAVA